MHNLFLVNNLKAAQFGNKFLILSLDAVLCQKASYLPKRSAAEHLARYHKLTFPI